MISVLPREEAQCIGALPYCNKGSGFYSMGRNRLPVIQYPNRTVFYVSDVLLRDISHSIYGLYVFPYSFPNTTRREREIVLLVSSVNPYPYKHKGIHQLYRRKE